MTDINLLENSEVISDKNNIFMNNENYINPNNTNNF